MPVRITKSGYYKLLLNSVTLKAMQNGSSVRKELYLVHIRALMQLLYLKIHLVHYYVLVPLTHSHSHVFQPSSCQ
jgi:hypothetical protein